MFASWKKEDSELKRQYARIYEFGTSYIFAGAISQRLTSKNIKPKNKESRIAGLELADLLVLVTIFYKKQKLNHKRCGKLTIRK